MDKTLDYNQLQYLNTHKAAVSHRVDSDGKGYREESQTTDGHLLLEEKAMASWKDVDEEGKDNGVSLMLDYECTSINLTEQCAQLHSIIIDVIF